MRYTSTKFMNHFNSTFQNTMAIRINRISCICRFVNKAEMKQMYLLCTLIMVVGLYSGPALSYLIKRGTIWQELRQPQSRGWTVTRRLWVWFHSTEWNIIFLYFNFFALAPREKPGIEFRLSTRNTSKIWSESGERSVLILCSFCLPCSNQDTTWSREAE